MATDSTNLPQGELTTDAGTDMSGSELEFGAVQLAQVTADGGQPVQLPQGQQTVLIPVQPGQTLTLPTDSPIGLQAKIGPEGNLAIVVDGRTIILQGYVQANDQAPVRILTSDGDQIDVADVIAATDSSLDIQTAAGPATGSTGDTLGNGIFTPFVAGPPLGGLDAIGVLDPTALQYKLIDDERREDVEDEDTGPTNIDITFDILGGIVNEDDLPADVNRDDFLALKLVVKDVGNDGTGNDPFDNDGVNDKAGVTDDDGVPDSDREPLVTVATVKVTFGPDIPGTLWVDETQLPTGLTSEGETIIYEVLPPSGGQGNGIVGFVDADLDGKYTDGVDRLVFDIKVQEDSSNSIFHVNFTLYDNLDNAAPDVNGDGAPDLLGGDEQILGLPVKVTAKDSDGTPLSTIMNLGVQDDIPFFGEVVIGEGIQIINTDAGVTHDESTGVQNDADDQTILSGDALSLLANLYTKITNAGFSLPFGDSEGALEVLGFPAPGLAQTQVMASFGADQKTQEHLKDADDASARNSIFGHLEDLTDRDGDGLNDGENERPFELFMIQNGTGGVPAEDNLNTVANEGNLTIEDQPTNAWVWFNGELEQVFIHQIDAQTIVGYINLNDGGEESLQASFLKDPDSGYETIFVLSIDDNGVLSFVQLHQINHPDTTDHDEPLQILGEDGTPLIHVRISDYDGDHAQQPVQIVVEDDGPKFIKVYWGFDGDSTNPFNGIGIIDEDALPAGKSGGPGDDAGGKSADGQVFFDFGVDQPGTIEIGGLTITNSLGQTVAVIGADGTFTSGALFTADGRAIEVQVSVGAGGVITYQGVVAAGENGAGSPVFTLTLDGEGNDLGEFEFVLHLPLQHPFTDADSQNDGPQTAYEDNLNFDFTVIGKDVDNDTAEGHIKIRVDDDSPVATNDKDSVTEGEGNVATGNVVTGVDGALLGTDPNGTDGSKDAPGADQPYTISKLGHDGTTYNLVDNGDGTYSVTKNGGNPLGAGESFDGKVLTIPTKEGATFEIVLVSSTQSEVGEYRYTAGEPPHHDSNKLGGPADTASSLSTAFDTVGEWTSSFSAAGVTLVANGGALAIKTVDVAGPNDYRGIGVSSGAGDEVEVDNAGPDETLELQLANLTNNATLTIGALFDGTQFDAGSQEILLWQVYNGAVLVASGQILGANNGLVSLDIDTGGQQFNKIVLTPIDNGAGANSGNNSDFLLLNIEICKQDEVKEKFDYTLRDADGDESSATLTIEVKDTQPTIPTETSGGITIIVDEDGLNPAGTIKDGIGDNQPGDLEEDHTGPNAAKDDAKHIGTIPFVAGADPVTVELSVGNGGDTGLLTLAGQKIFAAWDAEESRLVGYVEGTNPLNPANQIFVMQITGVVPGSVSYTFTLLQPIKHADIDQLGDNTENYPDPYVNIQVQIEDKDCDVAFTNVKVIIDDDMPVVDIKADSRGTTQHDETPGRDTGSGDDDQNGNPPALFNVLGAGPAIGWARDGDSVVEINTARYGADGPGTAVYSLVVAPGGADSGVQTTDGLKVWLFEGPNGIIVGRAGLGAGGATPDVNGAIIFAVSVDSNGVLTLVQYDSLKHPDNPNNYDEDIGLTASALKVKLTLTDADGDSASDEAEIGHLVRFDDDGPTAKLSLVHGKQVQHDETPGVQNPGDGDNDQAGALPAEFAGIVGTLIGWAKSAFAVVSTSGTSTGSDDEGATITLSLIVSSNGVDSQIDDTATGSSIYLYQNGAIVEGRVGGVGGPVAFAVSINPDGTLNVAQYRALEHPNTGSHDETISIKDSALKVLLTVIDGDGDKATDTIDIGDRVRFDDDGPDAKLDKISGASIVLDESVDPASGPYADPNANDEAGNVPNDIGYAKVAIGTLFTDNSTFGTDGPGTKTFSLSLSSNGTDSGLDDTATGANIRLWQVNSTTIEGRADVAGPDPVVFRITINSSTGEITISQFRAIEHPVQGDSAASHDDAVSMLSNKLFVNLSVTDGDNDKDSDSADLGKLIKFEDDGPVAVADVDSVKEDSGEYAIGNVITGANVTSFGSDANITDGNKDDAGSDGLASIKWKDTAGPGGFDGNGNIVGKYGTLFVDANGGYKYVLDNGNSEVDALNDGQTLEDVFTYVIYDKDGDSSSSTLTITIDGKTDTKKPNFEDENAIVDEDGLPAGILNDPTAPTDDPAPGDDVGGHQEGGQPDPASEAIFRDSLNIDWDTDVGTIVFSVTNADLADIHPLNGAVLTTANVSGNGTGDLKIWDGVPEQSNLILEVKVIDAATSVYEVQLYQPIQHTDPSSEDNKTLPVTVTATNGGGSSEHTLTVSIDDDRPVATDDPVTAAPGTTGTADVVFIVDVSGSMTTGGGSIVIPGVPDFPDNRLGLARYSMRELLENHPEIQNVQFVKFDDGVSSSVWMTRADALLYIAEGSNFVGGGFTNYDIALQEAMDIYDASARPAGEADQTIVYFLSDGVPNRPSDDPGITGEGTGSNVSIAEWEAFVSNPANNITNVFAIGMGGDSNVTNLEPVSFPNTDTSPADGDEDRVVVLSDANITDLTQTLDDLLSDVLTPVSGDVTSNDEFGADGAAAPALVSVEYDGTTYNFGPGTTEHTIDLGAGRGSLEIHDDGTYTYTPPSLNNVDGTPFYVEYAIKDGDGDTSTAKILFDLDAPPATDLNGAVAGDDVTVAFIEQNPVLIAPAAEIADDAATLASMTVTLTNRPDGNAVESLSVPGGPLPGGLTASYTPATGVLLITGVASLADYQAVLQSIVYNNSSDAPNLADRTVTVVVNDGTSNSVANVSTITVTPVNDAPDANSILGSYNATEQTNLNLHGTGLSISDIDAGSGLMTVTLSVDFGVITVTAGNSGVVGGNIVGSGTSSVQITGTVTQINNLLGGIDTGPGSAGTIVYNANSDNPPASAQLTLHVNDNGNTGGGNLTDTANVTINIAPQNDAPTTNNTNASGNEDAASIVINLSGGDVDGSVAQFKITSLPTNGKLYADAGLTNELTINETVNAIANAALVYFVPNANFNGVQAFQYAAIDDLGLADATPATASITVNPVNDPTDAVNDILIIRDDTTPSDYTIQSAWLLRNDQGVDGPLTITEVNRSGLDSPASTINNPGASFTIDPNGGNNFTYKASDGNDTDQATVDVQNDTSGSFDGGAADEIIVGTNSGETLNGNGGNDILAGGGGNDTLNGGAGDDWLVYDTADGTIDGGTGFDTLRFESVFDVNVDGETGGSSFNFIGRIHNIEAIDMRNGSASDDLGNTGGDNAISAADVIDITDSNNTLYIMGEGDGGEGGAADDEVRLDGSWTQGGSVTVNDPAHPEIHGLTFIQYTSGAATLFIQNTVDVDN